MNFTFKDPLTEAEFRHLIQDLDRARLLEARFVGALTGGIVFRNSPNSVTEQYETALKTIESIDEGDVAIRQIKVAVPENSTPDLESYGADEGPYQPPGPENRRLDGTPDERCSNPEVTDLGWAPYQASAKLLPKSDTGDGVTRVVHTTARWGYLWSPITDEHMCTSLTDAPERSVFELDVKLYAPDAKDDTFPDCDADYEDRFWARPYMLPVDPEAPPVPFVWATTYPETALTYLDNIYVEDPCNEATFTVGVGNPRELSDGITYSVYIGTTSGNPSGGQIAFYGQLLNNDCWPADPNPGCVGLTNPSWSGAEILVGQSDDVFIPGCVDAMPEGVNDLFFDVPTAPQYTYYAPGEGDGIPGGFHCTLDGDGTLRSSDASEGGALAGHAARSTQR